MIYLPQEDGQGLVEYGLILVLVAIVVVIVLSLIGTQLSQVFSKVADSVPGGG
ncbi:MAG: Flp family type IVb pilin [Thermoflexales bacterium]|nr:Flp family type IVb pilin [Thermoflexales bacterium]